MANDFTGMRKVTIRDNTTGGTGTFAVMTPDKIGADGLSSTLETNELTTSSYAGDITSPNGTNIAASTLTLLPTSIKDFKAIWPTGYDEATGTWQPPIGGCTSADATVAWEKVCDTKGNQILRHCQIALSGEFAFSRDDAMAIEVSIYPVLSEGSEYGLSGDKANQMFPWQFYDGVYDPATDKVTFDGVTAP